MPISLDNLQTEAVRRNVIAGELKGTAKSVLIFLDARRIALTQQQRDRIANCKDLDQLNRWVREAATVTSADDLFGADSKFQDPKFQDPDFRDGFKQGYREGWGIAVITVLDARRIILSPEQRASITSCTDSDQLKLWFRRAAFAHSADDVFTDE